MEKINIWMMLQGKLDHDFFIFFLSKVGKLFLHAVKIIRVKKRTLFPPHIFTSEITLLDIPASGHFITMHLEDLFSP